MKDIGKHEETYTDSGVPVTVTYHLYEDGQVLIIPSADYKWAHISDLPSKVREGIISDTVRGKHTKQVSSKHITYRRNNKRTM